MLRRNLSHDPGAVGVDDLFSVEFRAQSVFFELLPALTPGEDCNLVIVLQQGMYQQASDDSGTADQYFHSATSD